MSFANELETPAGNGRTLASARQAFEALAPQLNPIQYRSCEQELQAGTTKALEIATRYVDERYQATIGSRQETLTGWCELRDAYTALADEGAKATLEPKEFNERLSKLRERQRELERHSATVATNAEVIERIESDPETWVDTTFFDKYPHMRPTFTF